MICNKYTFGINGNAWEVRIVDDLDVSYHGVTYFDKRRIVITNGLSDKKFLEVSVHEMMHAIFSEKSEKEIASAAKTIGSILWKCGYRRENAEKKKKSKTKK